MASTLRLQVLVALVIFPHEVHCILSMGLPPAPPAPVLTECDYLAKLYWSAAGPWWKKKTNWLDHVVSVLNENDC